MKIAQIVCTYPPYRGGIGNVAKIFSEKLSKQDHQVTVFTPLYRKVADNVSFVESIYRIKPLLKYGNGAFMPSLFFKLREFDCLILHFPFFGSAELLWLYSFFKPRAQRIYIYFHMDVINDSFLFKLLSVPSSLVASSLFAHSDKIFCSSFDYVSQSAIKNIYSKYKEKFKEVPFGVDTQRFFPSGKNEKKENLNILFVGGLDKAHYFKGLNNLIKAFSMIKNDNIELSIVGNGDLLDEYKALSKKLACAEKISFFTAVSDSALARHYQKADIFVLPSINSCEAFGLVLLEAMACATPVIASDLPGVRSVFQNNIQGLLVNKNDIADLHAKLKILIDDDELRNKMAREAYKLVSEKYDWDKVIDKLVDNIRK